MNVVRRLSDWIAARNLRWIRDLKDVVDENERLKVVRLRSYSGLIPLNDGDGAVLVWTYDLRPGANPTMMLRLTEDEAEAVYDSDPFTTGMIESVRNQLTNQWGVLTVRCGQHAYLTPYRVPRVGTEDEFIADLDRVTNACPAYSFQASKAMTREVGVKTLMAVGRARRDLARA